MPCAKAGARVAVNFTGTMEEIRFGRNEQFKNVATPNPPLENLINWKSKSLIPPKIGNTKLYFSYLSSLSQLGQLSSRLGLCAGDCEEIVRL